MGSLTLDKWLARALDKWREEYPETTVQETLTAIEKLRFDITELWLKYINRK